MARAASLTRARALCVPLGVHVFKQAFNIIHLLSVLSRPLFSLGAPRSSFTFLASPACPVLHLLTALSLLSFFPPSPAGESTTLASFCNRDGTTKRLASVLVLLLPWDK